MQNKEATYHGYNSDEPSHKSHRIPWDRNYPAGQRNEDLWTLGSASHQLLFDDKNIIAFYLK